MQQIKEESVEEESDYEPIVVSSNKKTTNSKYQFNKTLYHLQ